MNYEERQEEHIMSFGNEEWTLQSKKEGTQTWEMKYETKFIK